MLKAKQEWQRKQEKLQAGIVDNEIRSMYESIRQPSKKRVVNNCSKKGFSFGKSMTSRFVNSTQDLGHSHYNQEEENSEDEKDHQHLNDVFAVCEKIMKENKNLKK